MGSGHQPGHGRCRSALANQEVRYDQRPKPGTVVYLAPVTRLAGQLEHGMAAVTVQSYDWPNVVVVDIDGNEHTVFHANLLLHPRKQADAGDQANRQERKIPRPLSGKYGIQLAEGEGQGVLF